MSYRDNYALIDWSQDIVIERKKSLPPARSDLGFPMVITDQMSETEHPCDGKHYTSKRAFRQTTKANGCIEIGNDPARFNKPKPPKPDTAGVRKSLEKALSQVSL